MNGAPNVSFTPNTTITASEGSNNLIVYANDSADNWNSLQIDFNVNTAPPIVTYYIPFLYQRADNIYDAGVMAFNPGDTAANITINLYYLNGTLAAQNTFQVGSKAEVSKYAFDLVTGDSIFVGPAEIISDQPITAQGFIRTKASMVYSIAPQVRKPESAGEAHVPFLYQTVNASHDAGIMAMNSNSGTANIEIALYYPNGTKAGNISAIIGSNAELSKYAFDIAPNTMDFNGSAIVGRSAYRSSGLY